MDLWFGIRVTDYFPLFYTGLARYSDPRCKVFTKMELDYTCMVVRFWTQFDQTNISMLKNENKILFQGHIHWTHNRKYICVIVWSLWPVYGYIVEA